VNFRDNQLLALLTEEDLTRLAPLFERWDMQREDKLEVAKTQVSYVYFPLNGLASVIASDGSSKRVEVGPFGIEGMSGLCVVLGSRTSVHDVSVQVPGPAARVDVAALELALAESRSLHAVLLKYVHAFSVQTAQTLLVNTYADIRQRLARWILMTADRLRADHLPITHEFIAEMLGVRRPGVTTAIHELEGLQLIKASRGLVSVTNRSALEQLAGSTYGTSEAEYKRLLC
jgi:CRP-like cAMP-binding protein